MNRHAVWMLTAAVGNHQKRNISMKTIRRFRHSMRTVVLLLAAEIAATASAADPVKGISPQSKAVRDKINLYNEFAQ